MAKGTRNKDSFTNELLQVFAPTEIRQGTVLTVNQNDVLRFTSAGRYQINGAGVKAPYGPTMIMGINEGVNTISLFDASTGNTPESQIVEVM